MDPPLVFPSLLQEESNGTEPKLYWRREKQSEKKKTTKNKTLTKLK